MKCQECSDQLLAYLEGELTMDERNRIDHHLSQCDNCRVIRDEISNACQSLDKLPKPSETMAKRFSAALSAYKSGQLEGIRLLEGEQRKRTWIESIARNGYAQAAVIIFAFLIGILVSQSISTQETNGNRFDVIETELASLKEFTALSLLTQTSAVERLRGLEWLSELNLESEQVLEALYDKLNNDPNINVRFAALETLDAYAEKEEVRRKLVQLLETPNLPMIRAELIKLLVRHAEKDSVPTLIQISQDANEDETIRELATWSSQVLQQMNTDEI